MASECTEPTARHPPNHRANDRGPGARVEPVGFRHSFEPPGSGTLIGNVTVNLLPPPGLD
jgi:hypothetical protein